MPRFTQRNKCIMSVFLFTIQKEMESQMKSVFYYGICTLRDAFTSTSIAALLGLSCLYRQLGDEM